MAEAKKPSRFQAWRIRRRAQKEFNREKKDLLGRFEKEEDKFRGYYRQRLNDRIRSERGFAERFDKDYDVRTYDDFAKRKMREEMKPFTDYYKSVRESMTKMLEGAQKMAYAEALQKKGYELPEQVRREYEEGKATYVAAKDAAAKIEAPSMAGVATWSQGKIFSEGFGYVQSYLHINGIGMRGAMGNPTREAAQPVERKNIGEQISEYIRPAKAHEEINKQFPELNLREVTQEGPLSERDDEPSRD